MENSDTKMIQLAIKTLRNLPDLLVEDSGVLLPWGGNDTEAQALEYIRLTHRAHADWLRYYLLDDVSVLPELKLLKPEYKILAERTLSFLRLAQEINVRSNVLKKLGMTPLEFALLIEIEAYETRLHNSFINPVESVLGKSATYKIFKNYYDSLENWAGSSNSGTPTETEVQLSAQEFLEAQAALIAKTDIKFRNKHFRQYIRDQKRFYKELRDSRLNGFRLLNGRIEKLSEGRPKKLKSEL